MFEVINFLYPPRMVLHFDKAGGAFLRSFSFVKRLVLHIFLDLEFWITHLCPTLIVGEKARCLLDCFSSRF